MTQSSINFSALLEKQLMPSLHHAYNSLFAAADQAILTLAAKASVNKEQNRYYEAAQNLRIVRFEVIAHFSAFFLEGLTPTTAPNVDHSHAQSLYALLSIKPSEYQADTALAAALLDVNKRLNTLGADIVNPLMPEEFVHYFLQALAWVELDVHTKMLVLRMFERHVYSRLINFVAKLNDGLVEQGVLPALHTQPGSLSYSVNALVDKTLSETNGHLLHHHRKMNNALDELQADDVEKLWDVLDDNNKADAWQSFMLPRNILDDLKEHDAYPDNPSAEEQMLLDKIPLVAEIFHQLTNSSTLPSLSKAMLKALLLPYTRIALLDESFFRNESHAARLLLREIVELCEAWEPKLVSLEQDNLYRLLLNIVQAFVEVERLDKFDYQTLQFELLAYREAQRQKQAQSSQRYVDSAYGAQIAERARDDVGKLIADKLNHQRLPYSAYKFVQEAWGHVLYVHAMNTGVNSEPWRDAEATLDALIATFKPAHAYENRAQLLILLPSLLRELRDGLSAIDMNKLLINQWFDELESAHKTLAMSIGGVLNDNPLELLEMASAKMYEEEERVAPDNETPILDNDKAEAILDNISQGVWFNWHRPEGQIRCQLAAIIKHADKYILVERSGQKLGELLKRELVIKLQTQELEIVQTGVVFDKTLASVIDDIRTTR